MKIDRKLNLVFEIDQGDGKTAYAHSMPIEEATWESHYSVLSKTLASLYSDDFNPSMAARLTLLRLREVAREKGGGDKKRIEEETQKVETGLIAEIERRTNVIVLDAEHGWTPVPLGIAVQRDLLSSMDHKEVLSQAAFFTAASWVHTKSELDRLVIPMLKIYSAHTTSSTPTEYARSLPISMQEENTGEKATPSSTPI